jgi:hypothetical protein
MIVWGNRRRLCFSAWILAALFLIGLNGFHLIALENQPLVGHSPTIKALRLNLSQWENALTRLTMSYDDSGLRPVFARYQPQADPSTEAASAPDDQPSAVTPPQQIALPALSGIVQALDQQGKLTYYAVLDGRVCRTNDQVGTYVVEQISPRVVILNRAGRQWHIECPAPNYSEDRGN